MRIIHVSDRHYGQPGSVQANARINNNLSERVDIGHCIVIDTGDVVDTPTRRHYQTAESALHFLSVVAGGYILAPGNHDLDYMGLARSSSARGMWSIFSKDISGADAIYPQYRQAGDVAFVTLDTNMPPHGRWANAGNAAVATGLIGDDQIEQCQKMVVSAKDLGLKVVILMHHNPSGGNPTLWLADRHALGAALEDVGGVDLMLCGHLHDSGEWSDVFGARYLLASPKTPAAQGYREIWWDDEVGRFRWEWVGV